MWPSIVTFVSQATELVDMKTMLLNRAAVEPLQTDLYRRIAVRLYADVQC